MTPPNIITRAKAVGLEAIVIADHNSAENQQAFLELEKNGDKDTTRDRGSVPGRCPPIMYFR